MSKANNEKKKHPMQHLLAGGTAGLVESSICHPLDTIKTRMQLRRQSAPKVAQVVRHSLVEPALRLTHSLREPALRLSHSLREPSVKVSLPPPPPPRSTAAVPLGPMGTAARIVQREGVLALYKGLTAVYTGIIPKMAIRFVAFEQYREWGHAMNRSGSVSTTTITFLAGLASGLTEAIVIVTPAEVCKIRMQSQYHSLMEPGAPRKYTNVLQTAVTIVREEGIGALYKGVVPTMLRQGCNQAVNFTAYNKIKHYVIENSTSASNQLSPWQSLLIGGLSGGMGPLVNNPLDVVKTRLQKQVVIPGRPVKYTGLGQACTVIAREEGVLALWKGITPRLLRIMPGQAITFMTYEAVSEQMNKRGWFSI